MEKEAQRQTSGSSAEEDGEQQLTATFPAVLTCWGLVGRTHRHTLESVLGNE